MDAATLAQTARSEVAARLGILEMFLDAAGIEELRTLAQQMNSLVDESQEEQLRQALTLGAEVISRSCEFFETLAPVLAQQALAALEQFGARFLPWHVFGTVYSLRQNLEKADREDPFTACRTYLWILQRVDELNQQIG